MMNKGTRLRLLTSLACMAIVLTSCEPPLKKPKVEHQHEISENNDASETHAPETLSPDTVLDTPHPLHQVENPVDLTITQNIRMALIGDEAALPNGKSIKIMTVDGVVTLRGLVGSTEERENIVQKAKSIAGVKRIEDQLEVQSR